MADTFTPNLDFTLPEIGASDDTWGDKLNDDFDLIDALFGTTGEGTVIVRDINNDAKTTGISIDKAALTERFAKFKTAGVSRFNVGVDQSAESGANVGSNFQVRMFDDAGTFLGAPLQIERPTGIARFTTTPFVGPNEIIHRGNVANLGVPIGTPMMWMTDILPAGYLWMNGVPASRAAWPKLFNLWGTFYGAGDGVNTFGIPNWCECVPVARSSMAGSGFRNLVPNWALTVLNSVIGSATQALAPSNIPAHTHSGVTAGVGDHRHFTVESGALGISASVGLSTGNSVLTDIDAGADKSYGLRSSGSPSPNVGLTSPAGGDGGRGFTTDGGAGLAGAAHNNTQISTPCYFMVKGAE